MQRALTSAIISGSPCNLFLRGPNCRVGPQALVGSPGPPCLLLVTVMMLRTNSRDPVACFPNKFSVTPFRGPRSAQSSALINHLLISLEVRPHRVREMDLSRYGFVWPHSR
jgi:hypothetical protein